MTLLALLSAALMSAAPAGPAPRYALVVGNNEGAPQRSKLWFAERDADRVARALVELGGFPAEQVVVLHGQGAQGVRQALAQLEQRIARSPARERSLFVFYYSGHADAAALELGRHRLSFDELRELTTRSSAAAKVVLVDACQSGALTQVKGTRALPALDFPLLAPEHAVRGVAFVASTAMGEAAQESAALGGSFFSHHLEVALRGAGDSNGDGTVTLTEAFRYTSHQTVVGTTATVRGAQHPTYDVKMSGRGEVVLSELRRAEARLVLPKDGSGLYLVRGGPGVLAEIAGSPQGLTLGLPAGRYEVQRREGKRRTGGQVVLVAGETRQLEGMVALGLEEAAAKGGEGVEVLAGGAVITGLLPGSGASFAARVGMSRFVGRARLRLKIDAFDHEGRQGVLQYRLRGLSGAAAGLYGVDVGRIRLEVGPELGGTWASQKTSEARWSAPIWSAGAVAGVSLRLGDEARLALEVAGAAMAVPINHQWKLRPGLTTALAFGYGF
ncbi:caspase family protein [Pyxidicoccus xibeiensis]|uniref:caspase family protein n=1 Tax=Pyxidicoccus xibeiensis TaxID=2906759 RepID=UPI0020A7FA06|nr:caspase family protein [Pyxidicoccus xibeiensis]MCP3140517.1 caspase family protein [Pyxidicoccus xibeiensis]